MVKMSACHAVRSGFNSRHIRKNSYIAQRFRVLHCHCRGRGFDPRYNCENWFIGQMAKMSGCRPVRRGFESLIDRDVWVMSDFPGEVTSRFDFGTKTNSYIAQWKSVWLSPRRSRVRSPL